MPEILLFFIGAAGLCLLGVVSIVAISFLIGPEWFSRSFASLFGGFAGMAAAIIAVIVGLCACSGGCLFAFVLLMQQQ